MSFHSNLIWVRKIIGYLDEEPGCCYGFTMRWLEAHLYNEVSIFKNCIKLIQSFYEDQVLLYQLPKAIKLKKGQKLNKAEYIFFRCSSFFRQYYYL